MEVTKWLKPSISVSRIGDNTKRSLRLMRWNWRRPASSAMQAGVTLDCYCSDVRRAMTGHPTKG